MAEEEHKEHHSPKSKEGNVWIFISVILGIVLIAGFFTGAYNITGLTGDGTMSSSAAAQKVVKFLDEKLLPAGTSATLTDVNETAGMYLVTFDIDNQTYSAFVSKTGRYFFPQVYDIDAAYAADTPPDNTQPTSFDAPDAEKPTVKFFIMSFCPYGKQAEAGLKPVFDLFNDTVALEPHYVIYSDFATRMGAQWSEYCLDEEQKYCSLHGINEINEDVRQMCIDKYYSPTVWWNYVDKANIDCTLNDIETCWKTVASSFSIDTAKIEKCQRDEGLTLAAAELALNVQYGVTGSPTIFINEQAYSEARSPDAMKSAVCTGFATVPAECSSSLSDQSSAAGSCNT